MGDRDGFEKSIERAMADLSRLELVSPDDFPTMDLYMDQVTTFMERTFKNTLRDPDADKVLTKTMINNYAKNDLIAPPVRKKYSREHLFELMFIYYFKSFLSISDIQTLLGPMTERFFGDDSEYDVSEVYSEMRNLGRGARAKLKGDLDERVQKMAGAYKDAPEDLRDYLRKFAFICELGYDIFLRKTIIESLIDEMENEEQE